MSDFARSRVKWAATRIGGLIGGALCALAFTRLGRVHAAYGRPVLGYAGVAAVALGAVLVSYYAVESYT